jgi:short-subunit dehydrogenase
MNLERALITGASSGIGLHLAREFAQHGHPLVLIAPVEAELQQIARDFREEHNVEVRVIAKDLEQPDSPQQIADTLARDGMAVDILVNDAGLGQAGKFWEIPIERDISMLRLNVEAVVRLTKLFLPPMVQRQHGRILNLASVAGFEPGPNLALYHATKALILSLSEALATELDGTGVTVTALCPGPTDTDFFIKAKMLETRAFQKAHVMPPQEVAAAGYKALMAGKRVIVPGVANKALVISRRILPESAQAKKGEKMYERVPPSERKRTRGEFEAKAAGKSHKS